MKSRSITESWRIFSSSQSSKKIPLFKINGAWAANNKSDIAIRARFEIDARVLVGDRISIPWRDDMLSCPLAVHGEPRVSIVGQKLRAFQRCFGRSERI